MSVYGKETSRERVTWSNTHLDPLLIKLDWVLVSAYWGLSFPSTTIQPLARSISDHIPFVINIGSKIPESTVFKFENYWVDLPGFFETVDLHWNSTPFYSNAAKTLLVKFKQTRAGLRSCSKKVPNLNRLIHNSSLVLSVLDGLEDQRMLCALERRFRNLVKDHLNNLLESKEKVEDRETLSDGSLWVMKTPPFSRQWPLTITTENMLSSLTIDGDILITDHDQKAAALWGFLWP